MKDVSTLFQSATTIEIPEGLEERVFLSIQNAQQREYAFRRTLWGSLSLASLAVLAFSSIYTVHAFAVSSFSNYFSLIFSDMGSISLWWKDLGLSLVESLPVFGTLLLVGSIGLAVWSMRKFAKQTTISILTVAHA